MEYISGMKMCLMSLLMLLSLCVNAQTSEEYKAQQTKCNRSALGLILMSAATWTGGYADYLREDRVTSATNALWTTSGITFLGAVGFAAFGAHYGWSAKKAAVSPAFMPGGGVGVAFAIKL